MAAINFRIQRENIGPNLYKVMIVFMTDAFYSLDAGPLSVTICERDTETINCQNGKRIDVLDAMYGRQNRGTCPDSNDVNTNCRSQNSYSVVHNKCNGVASCVLTPTNAMFGGDPCRGTYKYLVVEYQCI